MTINDPIADALTRIRNAKIVKHESVSMPASNLKEELIKVLKNEGYVEGYTVEEELNNLWNEHTCNECALSFFKRNKERYGKLCGFVCL